MNRQNYCQEAELIINTLELEDSKKNLIRLNWLSSIIHYEKKISKNFFLHNLFSIIGIVGGISIPAVSAFDDLFEPSSYKVIVSILGIITASSVAINMNQKYDERWKHFRKVVEMIRIEGESYFSSAGSYYTGKTILENFSPFMGKLKDIKSSEINGYFSKINHISKKEKETNSKTNLDIS